MSGLALNIEIYQRHVIARIYTLQIKEEYLSLQLFDPVLGPRKGVGVGDVVDHDGSLSTTVVHWRKRVVSFLWQQGMWKMIRKIQHWSTIRR